MSMKFFKINENKIRCILDKSDLDDRHISIKEIAVGSDKAHRLLAELMVRANREIGFNADGAPLMVEAAQLPTGQVNIIISKTGKPAPDMPGFGDDEPFGDDIKINMFASAQPLEGDYEPTEEEGKQAVRDIINNFFEFAKNELQKSHKMGADLGDIYLGEDDEAEACSQEPLPFTEEPVRKPAPAKSASQTRIPKLPNLRSFLYSSLKDVVKTCKVIKPVFDGEASLYKNPSSGHFYLVIYNMRCDETGFIKACNIATEYGAQVKEEFASDIYYIEHYEEIYFHDAIKQLT